MIDAGTLRAVYGVNGRVERCTQGVPTCWWTAWPQAERRGGAALAVRPIEIFTPRKNAIEIDIQSHL
ncbi:Uncharacterised protein [Chromobacterium violaceum]|uniref:Uncharacterized protein n=1 Tax=Chromobacterium violaceum TaxID=536 RepID=A0A3S4LGD6_CHRVL|nr:Uncharacterised protein [Chromobacterium violaceum]